jgi:hypothetical protein
VDEESDLEEPIEETAITPVNIGGRPKGSTIASKRKQKSLHEEANCWAAKKLIEMQNEAKTNGLTKLPPKTIAAVIGEANVKFELDESHLLKKHTIKSRIRRGNPSGRMKTPMANVEPLLVEFCILSSQNGEPMN